MRSQHIAKIQQPGDLPPTLRIRRKQYILIVGVVLDDTHRKLGKHWYDARAVLQN
jgi:hypothetical protein